MEPEKQKQGEVGQLKCPAGYYLKGTQCILAKQYRTSTDLPRVIPAEPEPVEPQEPGGDDIPDIPSIPPEPEPEPEPPTPPPQPPTPQPPTPQPPTPQPPTPPSPPQKDKDKGASARDAIIGGTTIAGSTAVGVKGAQAIANAVKGAGPVEEGSFSVLARQAETDALLGDIEMGQVSTEAGETSIRK
jgi:outer membrane biosynthesis protein TonB